MLQIAIAAGLILGLIVGLGAAATGNSWLLAIAEGSAPFGVIFMNAIRMVVIPLIVFTALIAAATGTLADKSRERMINLADDASKALIKLVWWILYTAPIGVFGLIAPVTSQLGWELLQSLAIFIVCVFVGLVIFLLVVTIPLMYFLAGIVAPVPSSSVITMAPALDAVGVPVAGLALVLGIDRIPDMMRSAVNLLGQVSAAVLVDRWTGTRVNDQETCDQAA